MSDTYTPGWDDEGRSVVDRTIHHPCGAHKTLRYVYAGNLDSPMLGVVLLLALYTLFGLALGYGIGAIL